VLSRDTSGCSSSFVALPSSDAVFVVRADARDARGCSMYSMSRLSNVIVLLFFVRASVPFPCGSVHLLFAVAVLLSLSLLLLLLLLLCMA
jgi:hypothetical protein